MNARSFVAALLLVLPLAGGGIGRAAEAATTSTGASIQPQTIETTFPFDVADKTLPAGKYVIEQAAPNLLVFRPASGKGPTAEAPVLTRLAGPQKPLTQPEVVFDKVNNSYFISEIWLPGADGFLLGGIKEGHTHQRVRAAAGKGR